LSVVREGIRRTLGGLGRTLVTSGLLILLFVAYQLWGTGIFTARSQDRLDDEFATARAAYLADLEARPTSSLPDATGATTTSTAAVDPSDLGAVDIEIPPAEPGAALGRIRIPRIGVDWTFVQGTGREDLKKGPGHYPTTPYPGQVGNAAIAGHRTTYGAPFNRIDEIQLGDDILVETLWGSFQYRVYGKCIVSPDDTWVAGHNTWDASCAAVPLDAAAVEVTLSSCNPKYSAAERYIVKAALVPGQDPPAKFDPTQVAGTEPELAGEDLPAGPMSGALFAGDEALQEGLAGDPASRGPALVWGLGAALVGLAWWWAYRRYRHWATWLVGSVPFLAVLFGCYYFAERLLPAGY